MTQKGWKMQSLDLPSLNNERMPLSRWINPSTMSYSFFFLLYYVIVISRVFTSISTDIIWVTAWCLVLYTSHISCLRSYILVNYSWAASRGLAALLNKTTWLFEKARVWDEPARFLPLMLCYSLLSTPGIIYEFF